MQAVSDKYAAMMAQQVRNPGYAKVELQVIDLTAVPDSTLTDTGHAPFSDVTKTPALPAVSQLYATLEQDRLPVDGSQYIMPDSGAYTPQGYCSDVLSDDTSEFQHTQTNTSLQFPAGQADDGSTADFTDGSPVRLTMQGATQGGNPVTNPQWVGVKGGRNLLQNTSNPTGYTNLCGGSNSYSSIYVDPQKGNVFQRDTTLTAENYIWSSRTKPVQQSTKYTVSFDVWVNSYVSSIDIFWLSDTPTNQKSGTGFVNVRALKTVYHPMVEVWQRISITFTTQSNDYTGVIRVDNNGSTVSGISAILRITNLKLEQGEAATDWSPAPEDLTPANISNYAGIASLLTVTGSVPAGSALTWDGATAQINGATVPSTGSLIAYKGGTIVASSQYGFIGSTDYTYGPGNPVVSISFGSTHSLLGFTLVFDSLSNSFCTDFIVRSYAGATLLATRSVTGNTATQYMFTDGFTGINRVTVEFVKTNRPNNRVHLFGMAFGLIKTYLNDDFLDDGVSQDMAADPISSELPTAQLAFSVNNYDGSYNPDSPSGVYAAIQQEQAVILSWGRDVGDGAIEWMPGGRFYLTDWTAPANKQSATFTANSLLDFMQGIYPRGVYAPSGASLYSLALAVLQYYGLPKQPDGSNPWVLDSSLQAIYTTAPLPAQAGRELLQLIANAAMCVLSIDRQGRICIGPASTVGTGYLLPLDLAMEYPENTLTPPLQEVDVNLYAYAPAAASSPIYTGTYAINGTQTIHIDYSGSAAANVSAAVTNGTLVSASYYAYSCDLTITGTGSVTVTLTGYTLQSTTSVVAYAPGGSGEVCPVDNALITDPTNAANVAQWTAAYLSLRRTYTEDYRGEPALDAGDLIDLQTQYSDAVNARVLEAVLKFQSGLSGTLTMKGMS